MRRYLYILLSAYFACALAGDMKKYDTWDGKTPIKGGVFCEFDIVHAKQYCFTDVCLGIYRGKGEKATKSLMDEEAKLVEKFFDLQTRIEARGASTNCPSNVIRYDTKMMEEIYTNVKLIDCWFFHEENNDDFLNCMIKKRKTLITLLEAKLKK